jgi:hypothetical protein
MQAIYTIRAFIVTHTAREGRGERRRGGRGGRREGRVII